LTAGGFDSIEKIAAATKEQLMEVPKIGEKTAERILSAAQGHLQGQGKKAESAPSTGEADHPVEEEAEKPSQTSG
jgi:Holliday junction resolvasome RuvABC DNA-binding subunit